MNTQLVKEKQDLTYLSWSMYRSSSGTAGSFLKSHSELGGKQYALTVWMELKDILPLLKAE